MLKQSKFKRKWKPCLDILFMCMRIKCKEPYYRRSPLSTEETNDYAEACERFKQNVLKNIETK